MLPKPYYDEDGIVIYNVVIRVYLPRGTEKRIQAVAGTRCKTYQAWGRASLVERRSNHCKVRQIKSVEAIRPQTLPNLRGVKSGTPSRRWGHPKQFGIKYPVCLQEMSHEGGRKI